MWVDLLRPERLLPWVLSGMLRFTRQPELSTIGPREGTLGARCSSPGPFWPPPNPRNQPEWAS